MEVKVEEKKTKLYPGLSGIIFSVLLCAIYVYLRRLPFFDLYLDADRRKYFLVVIIFSVIGVFFYMIAKEKIDILRLKLPLYALSFFFLAGNTIVFLIVNGTSSKGWEWAFSTVLIGLFPALSIAFGFLILYGHWQFSKGLLILFCVSALFYIVMFTVQLGVFGNPSGPKTFFDILFASLIIIFSFVSISFNLKCLKASS
jgi:hypothetical protein